MLKGAGGCRLHHSALFRYFATGLCYYLPLAIWLAFSASRDA